ncbi:MAG: acyl-CoA dehydrogenase family protein [Gammaproteobacteria bacterium]|nr:acyl-CoA dehydrogenase family protein [Gammaproteobacteria bacterium]
MDFNDTPAEAEFRLAARSWLADNAEPQDPATPKPGVFFGYPSADEIAWARAWQRKKYDAGWAGIAWPKAYGGRGGSIMEQIIWSQEELRYRTPPLVLYLGLGHVAYTIMQHGSDEQKSRYLPPLLKGEEIWCQLFSEPGAGSDFGGLACRAERDGGDWLINGEKIWISDGDYAEFGALVTRTNPDVAKHKGMTYFLVDMQTPGIEVENIRQINGRSHISRVRFTNVRVADSQRVGEVDDGWSVSLTTLMYERLFVGTAGANGQFGGPVYRHLVDLAKRVTYQGGPAIEHPLVRQRLADFRVRSKELEHNSYRVLTLVSRGEQPGPEGSISKLALGLLIQEMSNFALELQQGAGLLLGDDAPEEGIWQESMMEIPCMRIAGGTDEIQRTIIGERVLGLPPERPVPRNTPFKEIPRDEDAVASARAK